LAPSHLGVLRCAVEVPPVLLGVLAVIALAPGESVNAFLQDRIDAVPQRESETPDLPVVANGGESVLAPAVRTRPRVVVRKVVPRVAVRAVVLAHGAPRAFADIRAPCSPRRRIGTGETGAFRADPL